MKVKGKKSKGSGKDASSASVVKAALKAKAKKNGGGSKKGKKKNKKDVSAESMSKNDQIESTSTKDSPAAKVKKIPKIRRQATTENVEENYIIVPWASRAEWETVCHQFHDGCYNEVIARIAVWHKRVPTLPVGVEATLFLLEAIVYDKKFIDCNNEHGNYTEDQARSLYSLAIIRYLNHVSQLATQSLGESSNRLTRELASIVDTPEWLVSLRNDVSHGPSAPSIEVLRLGGNFVLHWLKTKYWKLPGDSLAQSTTGSIDPFAITSHENEGDKTSEITQLLTAYIAARIYKLRGLGSIKDLEIIRHIPKQVSPVKTKVAIIALRNSLRSYLDSHPSLFCTVISQELIPSPEFYQDFISLFQNIEDCDKEDYIFEKLYGVWLPVIKLLENKGYLVPILSNLCEVVVNPEYEKLWNMTARWIDKILESMECSGKKHAKQLVNILTTVIKRPNDCVKMFLERLLRLMEPRLGQEKIQKLEFLASIWIEENTETKKRKKQPSLVKLFTLNDIETGKEHDMGIIHELPNQCAQINLNRSRWTLDERGEDFWSKVPIGTVL